MTLTWGELKRLVDAKLLSAGASDTIQINYIDITGFVRGEPSINVDNDPNGEGLTIFEQETRPKCDNCPFRLGRYPFYTVDSDWCTNKLNYAQEEAKNCDEPENRWHPNLGDDGRE